MKIGRWLSVANLFAAAARSHERADDLYQICGYRSGNGALSKCLQEGRKSANIHAGSELTAGIPNDPS
jgi:hypothetical protein